MLAKGPASLRSYKEPSGENPMERQGRLRGVVHEGTYPTAPGGQMVGERNHLDCACAEFPAILQEALGLPFWRYFRAVFRYDCPFQLWRWLDSAQELSLGLRLAKAKKWRRRAELPGR